MATAGSGDVLTGLLAALLARGMTPSTASRLGVHLHGLAGDLAAKDLGTESLIASDLVDYLPVAFQSLAQS
jgi:NAD(P)H-hydrate epimerase